MKNLHKMKNFMLVILLTIITSLGFSQAQWNYISPEPGSKYINPENNIALRHGEVIDQTSIKSNLFTVIGSKQGKIQGNIKLSVDGRTLIFIPSSPFELDEKISVLAEGGIKTKTGLELPELSFDFKVKPIDNTRMLNTFYQHENENEIQNTNSSINESKKSRKPVFKSTNSFPDRFPVPNVTEFDSPSEGYIFTGPRPWQSAPYDTYFAILDNYGTPVFYRQSPRRTNDFKLIANNQLTYCDFDGGNVAINKYLVMDSHFNYIDTLTMANGYHVDQHDILMRENGNHFLMAYDPQVIGMDTVVPGGNPLATVVGLIIQELDPDHNTIFQWRSWDHFEITDANHTDLTGEIIDYAHGNAFEIDHDGNLLISSRNMEEITKLDINSGDIIWRFGLHAQNNMFTFTNDTVGFSWQHDVRRLDNGNITVYDNGNYHTPPMSQAVEYHLDEENFTAELVWNYIHEPAIFARATGANRRLENNNAFICWGLTWPINYSEVTHDGSLAWEMQWSGNTWDYRAFKFDWTTDLFEPSQDSIDFGIYEDYIAWPMIITLTNNSDEPIEITSTHNNLNSYQVITPLPLEIPANGTVNFQFNLNPVNEEGQLDDVLTLNCDSYFSDTLNQRISRQIFLTAYIEDNNPPVASTNPEDGASDVERDIQIGISFNETVKHTDGAVLKSADLQNILIFKENDSDGSDVEFTAYLDAWKRNITILPLEILDAGMQYYVELSGGDVADREGHILEDAVITTFTTLDDVTPTVEINPADSTTGAYINQMITFSFDEAVQKVDGSAITSEDLQSLFNLKHNDDEGEMVEFVGLMNDENNLITIHPVEYLDTYQYYYIEMMPDMIMDMAGNIISDINYSHFETGEEVGISEINHIDISLNPNPTSDNVEVSFKIEGNKLVEVFDINGRKVESFYTDQSKTTIQLSQQNVGVYLLKVTFDNGSIAIKKIIKY